MIRLSCECDLEERLVVGIRQFQVSWTGRVDRQSVYFKLGQHFTDPFVVELETRAGKYLGVFGKDALVVTDLNCAPANTSVRIWAGFP